MEDSLTPTSPDGSVDRLISLIKTLRGDNGCPWDKKQTPASISRYVIEEAYELVDAIVGGDLSDIREEAGDVLFQLLFVVELYHEAGRFSLADVIRRHHTDRIRYAAPDRVPPVVREAVIEHCIHIADTPVLMQGRIELLWYLQEQSVCVDYHRYGNLGARSDEPRSEPL